MRIALLLYGRINKFKEHRANIIESFGKDNQVDIFYSCDGEDTSAMLEFIDLYKPIKVCNDKITDTIEGKLHRYPNPPSPEYFDLVNIYNMSRHFINKSRVFKLLEEHIEQEHTHYDLVISTRIDIFYNESFIHGNIEENTIYIPMGYNYGLLAVNDQIAHGTLSTMKKYMNMYDNIINYLETGCLMHPESLVYKNIIHNNINIVRYPLSYSIIR
jgi:hypothetical protein